MICKRNPRLECNSNGKQCDFCSVSENKFDFEEFIKSGNKSLNKKEENLEDIIKFWENLKRNKNVIVIF